MAPLLQQFVFSKRYTLARHLLFWVVVNLALIVMQAGYEDDLRMSLTLSLLTAPVHMILTYGILLWLVPRYLVRAKYIRFSVFLLVWILTCQCIFILVNHYVIVPVLAGISFTDLKFSGVEFLDWVKLMVGCTIAGAAVFIKMFKYWYTEQEQKQRVEKEKIHAELKLLKAQLHPHFLFNTLNNLFLLVNEKSDKAPKMLLRLSALLSYVLYECKSDEVLLSNELNAIKDYVALEQERYGDRLEISLNFSGDIEGKKIAPLLFQPFIENAFKHGSSEQLGNAWMSIELSVMQDDLNFQVINSCEPSDGIPDPHRVGGIGIENVKKRLELLYPLGSHLQYGLEETLYVVSLSIDLSKGVRPQAIGSGGSIPPTTPSKPFGRSW